MTARSCSFLTLKGTVERRTKSASDSSCWRGGGPTVFYHDGGGYDFFVVDDHDGRRRAWCLPSPGLARLAEIPRGAVLGPPPRRRCTRCDNRCTIGTWCSPPSCAGSRERRVRRDGREVGRLREGRDASHGERLHRRRERVQRRSRLLGERGRRGGTVRVRVGVAHAG